MSDFTRLMKYRTESPAMQQVMVVMQVLVHWTHLHILVRRPHLHVYILRARRLHALTAARVLLRLLLTFLMFLAVGGGAGPDVLRPAGHTRPVVEALTGSARSVVL